MSSVQRSDAYRNVAKCTTNILRPDLLCLFRLLVRHFELLRLLFHVKQKLTPTTRVVLVLEEVAPVTNMALCLIIWVSVFFLYHIALLRGRDRNLQHLHDAFHFTQKLKKENDYVLTGKLWKYFS